MGKEGEGKDDLLTVPQPWAVPHPMIVLGRVVNRGDAVGALLGVTVSMLNVTWVRVITWVAVAVRVTVTVGGSLLPFPPGMGELVLSTPVVMMIPVALPGG